MQMHLRMSSTDIFVYNQAGWADVLVWHELWASQMHVNVAQAVLKVACCNACVAWP